MKPSAVSATPLAPAAFDERPPAWAILLFFGFVGPVSLSARRAGFIWNDNAHVTKPALDLWSGLARI